MFSMNEKRKTFILLLTVSALMFLYLFSYYLSYVPIATSHLRLARSDSEFDSTSNVSRSRDIKYILYWTKMFRSTIFHFPKNGSELFEGCEYDNCFATNNKTMVPIDQFAALLFYSPVSIYDRENETFPAKRSPHQRYIYANAEAPARFYGPSKTQYVINDFFNWTMTYRFDSDIVRRHGFIVKKDTKYKIPSKDYFKNKTGTVAWVVSNCNSATNRRDELAKKLGKYVSLDIYGRCGDKECTEDCFDMIERKYKFYLSFENSHCRDYTTEKLYKILQRNLVPIVYGGGDYKAITPPNSVINVEDFDNIEELAYFINYLNDNLEDYLEYFEWKKEYKVSTASKPVVCKLCEMLNDPTLPPKVYKDINHWWFSKEMAQCRIGDELPRIAF